MRYSARRDCTCGEQWRAVVGYEGIYEVSSAGRIRNSHGKVLRQFLSGRRKDRWAVDLYNGTGRAGRRVREVHLLVLEAFVGPKPEGMEACHSDGVSLDNRVCNLRWDTHSENERDRVRHGTHNNATKTQCPYDHLLVRPNLTAYGERNNRRICLTCHRSRAYLKNHPGADPAEVRARYYHEIMGGTR